MHHSRAAKAPQRKPAAASAIDQWSFVLVLDPAQFLRSTTSRTCSRLTEPSTKRALPMRVDRIRLTLLWHHRRLHHHHTVAPQVQGYGTEGGTHRRPQRLRPGPAGEVGVDRGPQHQSAPVHRQGCWGFEGASRMRSPRVSDGWAGQRMSGPARERTGSGPRQPCLRLVGRRCLPASARVGCGL